jgi:DNA-directed RNA polymerase alpha subunit
MSKTWLSKLAIFYTTHARFRPEVIIAMLTSRTTFDIECVRESDSTETAAITFRDCPLSLTHALRRIMLSDIRTPAICDIELLDHRSQITAGMLTNRIGLVPLQSHHAEALRTNCDCKDRRCRQCSVELRFDVMGPGTMNETHIVAAGERREGDDDDDRRKRGRQTAVAVETIKYSQPITIHKLGPNERVRGRAWAKLGTHEQHAKFACVTTVGLQTPVDIRLLRPLQNEQESRALMSICPRRLFVPEIEDGKDSKGVDASRIALAPNADYGCIKCQGCLKIGSGSSSPLVSIVERPAESRLTVETVGQWSAHDILQQSLRGLLDRVRACKLAMREAK